MRLRSKVGHVASRPAVAVMAVRAVLAVGAILAVVASACSSTNGAEASLTVLAAASLTESFSTIGTDFEHQHPGVRVQFSFGPSDGLAGQIREGAPADVFASASPKWMDDVATNGPGLTRRAVFARNLLVVITPADDPEGVGAIEDLAAAGVKLVLAAPGVPAGEYAREALAKAGIAEVAEANVVSNEEDVKAVVQKVALGEADAGIVYRTDVTAAVSGRLRVVEIPAETNVSASYPIAVVSGTHAPGLAEGFLEFVLGPGQATLASFGFLPP